MNNVTQPYDYLALVPVVEGAGGKITNWSGESLRWWPEIGMCLTFSTYIFLHVLTLLSSDGDCHA